MERPTVELPIEKQFAQRSFEQQVDNMSGDQARELLKRLHHHQLAREVMYQKLLAHRWGMNPHPGSLPKLGD